MHVCGCASLLCFMPPTGFEPPPLHCPRENNAALKEQLLCAHPFFCMRECAFFSACVRDARSTSGIRTLLYVGAHNRANASVSLRARAQNEFAAQEPPPGRRHGRGPPLCHATHSPTHLVLTKLIALSLLCFRPFPTRPASFAFFFFFASSVAGCLHDASRCNRLLNRCVERAHVVHV